MCGVPYHAAPGLYIRKLNQRRKARRRLGSDEGATKKNPPTCRKIVDRESYAIISAGTVRRIELARCEEREYLGAIDSDGDGVRFAYADLSHR